MEMLLINLLFPNQTAIVGQQTVHHDFQRDIPVAKLRQHYSLISTQINVNNIRIYRIWVVIPSYKNHIYIYGNDCKHHRWSFSGEQLPLPINASKQQSNFDQNYHQMTLPFFVQLSFCFEFLYPATTEKLSNNPKNMLSNKQHWAEINPSTL